MWREQLMAEIDEIEQEIADLSWWLACHPNDPDYKEKEIKLHRLKIDRRFMLDDLEGDHA